MKRDLRAWFLTGPTIATAALTGCLDPLFPDIWDPDEDGYGGSLDCDQTDPSRNVYLPEDCFDGIDNDCDGQTDEDDADDCWDLDGDGVMGSGHGPDCDDGDASVYPGADELCDGKDNDCSGDGADEGTFEPDVAEDRDKDHHLDCTRLDADHQQPEDDVIEDVLGFEDCDDDDRNTYPGAPELCGDQVRNDCGDGEDQVCPPIRESPSLEAADAIWVGEADYDQAGIAIDSAGDLDGDGFADLLVGARTQMGADTGRVYALFGPRAGTHDLAGADLRWTGEDADLAGSSVSGGADLDGDGELDLVVGAPSAFATDTDFPGEVYALHGPDLLGGELLERAGTVFRSDEGEDYAGRCVSTGDVDVDGRSDLLIGAYQASPEGVDTGAAYLFHGRDPADVIPMEDADAVFRGDQQGDRTGFAVTCEGSVNGDLAADVLVGADGADGATGAVYLFAGPVASGSWGPEDATAIWSGEQPGDEAGYAVATGGDANGDGVDDLLIGAPGAEGGGVVYLVWGPDDSGGSLSAADARFSGMVSGDYTGASVAFAGDVDCWEHHEILIGAPNAYSETGVVYLLGGSESEPLAGEFSLFERNDAILSGEDAGDRAGVSVAGAGDVNFDGCDDILIGSTGARDSRGAVYLFYGGRYEGDPQ